VSYGSQRLVHCRWHVWFWILQQMVSELKLNLMGEPE